MPKTQTKIEEVRGKRRMEIRSEERKKIQSKKTNGSEEVIIKNYRKLFETNNGIIHHAHAGVGVKAVTDFGTISGKNQKQIADLIHTTSKTLQNYSIGSRKLPTLQSEILLKLFALYDRGIEVFGDKDSFNRWLLKPSYGLYNTIPDKLLSTATGINLVMDELSRIEYGDLS